MRLKKERLQTDINKKVQLENLRAQRLRLLRTQEEELSLRLNRNEREGGINDRDIDRIGYRYRTEREEEGISNRLFSWHVQL